MSILCVSVIGVHLNHSQVQNPVGITAVGYIQLYCNLMCICEYVKHQFITLILWHVRHAVFDLFDAIILMCSVPEKCNINLM